MDISKNSILRLLLYIGIIVSSANISNYVNYHFLYVIKRKVLCPALGAVYVCEYAETVGWMGVVTGNVLIGLLVLKSTENLKNNWILRKLEPLICFSQFLIQNYFIIYFTAMIDDAGSVEDMRTFVFVSFFMANVILFAINGILSFLEELKRERIRS